MSDIFFLYNNVKYVVEYINNSFNLYKEINGNKEVLSQQEKDSFNNLLNRKNGYIYDSSKLSNIVYMNKGIEKKEYIMNYLNWLEKIIPEDCRNNLYRNAQTLRASIDIDLSRLETYSTGSQTVAGYNTKSNVLVIDSKSLQELWKVAQQYVNPQDFYYRNYSQTLLHELVHMASSYYNDEMGISYCGFDRYPAGSENEKNRGLTEGFTEIVAMAGIPNGTSISSNYLVEVLLLNQLFQLVGNETIVRAFFSNQGIYPIQEKLYELINDPVKCYELFRNIELNFNIRGITNEQNVLGGIQLSLLDYLDAKLESMQQTSSIEEISKLLQDFEAAMITPERLKMMRINPQCYYGIAESLSKYDAIKTKCLLSMRDSRRSNQ